ncbi:MAG: porin family protein [Saprospiraceae bacterium]
MKPSFARDKRPVSFLPLALACFCLAILLPGQVQAQQPQRFSAGLILGLTASQIDGDQSAGFNKLGLQAGLRGIAKLGKRTDASVEILYSQRGSQSTIIKEQYDPFYFTLRLDYIEVPVQWHYKDWKVTGEDGDPDWYKAAFNIGLCYARYMGTKTKGDPQGLDVVALDFLKKNDLAFVVGLTFMASRHFGFTARYVRSLTSMYDPRDYDPAPSRYSLINRSLNFQMVYLF